MNTKCYRKEENMEALKRRVVRPTKLSTILSSMKSRCYNPNNKDYKRYGARGITICDEWMKSEKVDLKGHSHNVTKGFVAFRKWALSNGYKDGLTIDRIDNNKGYSPSNCRWVSWKVQHNNQSNNHYETYKGRTQSFSDWQRELGFNYRKVLNRLNRGWPVERAFETK